MTETIVGIGDMLDTAKRYNGLWLGKSDQHKGFYIYFDSIREALAFIDVAKDRSGVHSVDIPGDKFHSVHNSQLVEVIFN